VSVPSCSNGPALPNGVCPYLEPTQTSSVFSLFSLSLLADIQPIIQGSAIGAASYVVNAADLTTVTPGNAMFKYADDTYIVIPVRNTQSRGNELDNVSKWALANNLRLNKAKLQICQLNDPHNAGAGHSMCRFHYFSRE